MKFIFLFIPFALYFGSGNQLTGTKWNLYSIQNDKENFKFVLIKVSATLEFTDSTFFGKMGCNDCRGNCDFDKEFIQFKNMDGTARRCVGDNIMVENFLFKNLSKLYYTTDLDTLILSDQKGIVLKYTKKK